MTLKRRLTVMAAAVLAAGAAFAAHDAPPPYPNFGLPMV